MMMNQEDETLLINISGHRFQTLRQTLEKYPETLLGCNKREAFFNHRSNEYFFDRDANVFRHILNFYRTGKLHYPIDECITSYVEELTFFGLPSDVISDCCHQGFLFRKHENDERLLGLESSVNSNEPTSLRQRLWKAFKDPHSSTGAMILYCVIALFIIVPALANIIASVPCGVRPGRAGTLSCGERYKIRFFCLELAAIIFYTIEYLLRLFAAPSRLKFMISRLAIIDLFVIGSFFFGIFMADNESSNFTILRVFRLYAISSSSKHSHGSSVIKTLGSIASEIGFLIFSLIILTNIFATGLFLAERNVDGTNFASIPAAFWYTIGTMMMTGNRGMVPETIAGKIVSCACSICGLVFIAVLVSVIVANYNRTYIQHQRFDKGKLLGVKANDQSA